jgi:hypothetical protein
MEGDPWHGDSIVKILGGVSAERASAQRHIAAHSIWEIVRHMTAWTGEVSRRLAGHAPALPQEGDWPPPSGTTEEDWKRDVAELVNRHHQLIATVSTLSDEHLYAPPVEGRDRPAGSGVSQYVLIHGLAQHHAYHAGQISLLKKTSS